MCYNSANHWVLGWFHGAHLELQAPQRPRTVTVIAFVDYRLRQRNDYVLVKIGNLYFQYNRAKKVSGSSTSGAFVVKLLRLTLFPWHTQSTILERRKKRTSSSWSTPSLADTRGSSLDSTTATPTSRMAAFTFECAAPTGERTAWTPWTLALANTAPTAASRLRRATRIPSAPGPHPWPIPMITATMVVLARGARPGAGPTGTRRPIQVSGLGRVGFRRPGLFAEIMTTATTTTTSVILRRQKYARVLV